MLIILNMAFNDYDGISSLKWICKLFNGFCLECNNENKRIHFDSYKIWLFAYRSRLNWIILYCIALHACVSMTYIKLNIIRQS